MIFPLALLDREVIYAGNAPAHKALLIEFPVFVAVAAKPAAAIIMPFVGKTHRDAVLAEGPDFLEVPQARGNYKEAERSTWQETSLDPSELDRELNCTPWATTARASIDQPQR